MNIFEMIVGIVLIAAIARVAMQIFGHGDKAVASPADPDPAQLRAEVASLRERVQVLERIVTDTNPALDLDARIERLRDQ